MQKRESTLAAELMREKGAHKKAEASLAICESQKAEQVRTSSKASLRWGSLGADVTVGFG